MEKRKKSTGNRLLEHHVSKDAKRRKMKPITEKIRRERINNSLDELKLLILSALNEDVSHYAKMEKADILEMAVKYIKRLQNVKQGLQGECPQVTKADTATRIPSVTTATTTHCNESNTLHGKPSTEQPSLQTRPSTTGSLDLVLPAIPITIPDVVKETPAFSSSCGSFPITSTNASCSLHEKEVASFPFPKTYNDSKRSPFAAKEQNALNTSSYKDSIPYNQSTGDSIDYRPEKVRLPGMECFIRRNNNRTAVLNRETDKENAASFDDFVHQYNRGFPFDNPQFALTLWRPW